MMSVSTNGDKMTLFYIRKCVPDISEIVEEPLSNDELIDANMILKEMSHNKHLFGALS
jgi:hypothetical protein